MLKKVLSLTLAGSLLGSAMHIPTYGQPQTGGLSQQSEKVRTQVTRIGTGKRARVEVRLSDSTKLKGYVGAISEETFTLVDSKRGTVTTIPYERVQRLKSTNHGGRDLAVLGAIMAGVIISVLALVNAELR